MNLKNHILAFDVSNNSCSVAISVDGFGDFSSGAWGIGRGCDIEVLGRIYFPHSLGISVVQSN
jgi:carbamoyltransferase